MLARAGKTFAIAFAACVACNTEPNPAPAARPQQGATGKTSTTTPTAGGADASGKISPPVPPPGGTPPSPPTAAVTAKEKKRVTFKGSRADDVPGYLWLPQRSPGQKFPAVLAMYGIKGSKDDGSIGRAADILSDDGFVVMTIDWPGTGERGNIGNQDRITNPDVKEWTVGDYRVAVDYLTQQQEVDGAKVGYVGASMGAMTGIAFAARDQRVRALAAIVPIPNPLWGDDEPSARIAQIAPRPVLCISTSDNSDFSGLVCQHVTPPGHALSLPGGHELEGFRDQVVTEVKTFLDGALKH